MNEIIDAEDLKYKETYSAQAYDHTQDHQLNRGDRTLNTRFLKLLVSDLEIWKKDGFKSPIKAFQKPNNTYISHYAAEIIVDAAFDVKPTSYDEFLTQLEDNSRYDEMREEFKPHPNNELVKLVHKLGMKFNQKTEEERNKAADKMVALDQQVATSLRNYLVLNKIIF